MGWLWDVLMMCDRSMVVSVTMVRFVFVRMVRFVIHEHEHEYIVVVRVRSIPVIRSGIFGTYYET